MRVLEGLHEGKGNVDCQNGLELVTDAGDEAIQDEGRSVATHSLLLELGPSAGLQRVDILGMAELSEVDLGQLVDLATKSTNLTDDINNQLAAG